MDNSLRALSEVDRIIHEPARATLVAILYTLESADFLYLQRETGLTKGNLSAHLTKLEEAGYIKIEKTYQDKHPLTVVCLTIMGRQAFEKYRRRIIMMMERS